MATLGEMIVRVGADTKKFVIDMQDVQKTVNDAAQAVDQSSQRWRELGSQLTSVGTALTGILSLPIAGASAAALSLAGSYEQAGIAFTTMLGSGEKAEEMLNRLRDFAARTPFQFDDLVTATQRMMAYGVAAEDVIPTLEAVGNAISAIGGGSAEIDRAITALGQMQAKGTVSAEEMRQLAELGLPAWQYLADAIGVSIPEAMDLVQKKAVEAKDAVPAILAAMQNDFSGMMDQQSQTLLGRWSTFKDGVSDALRQVGAALLPVAKSILEAVMPIVQGIGDLAKKFSELPQPVQVATIALGAVLAAAGPLLIAAGQIIALWPTLTAAFSAAGPVIGAVASPIGLVVAALGALALWVATNWESVKAVIGQAWDGLTEYWTAQWEGARDLVLGVWETIKSAAETAWGVIGPYVSSIWDTVVEAWQTVWDAVGPWIVGVWEGIRTAIDTVVGAIRGVAVAVWDEIGQAISRFIDWAKQIPGVSKLLSLDEAWKSAKSYEEQTKAATKATEDHAKKAALAVPKINLVHRATAKTRDVQKETNLALKDAIDYARKLTDKLEDQARALSEWKQKNKVRDELSLIITESDLMEQSFDLALSSVQDFGRVGSDEFNRVASAIKQLGSDLDTATSKIPDLNDSMRALGLVSETEVKQKLDDLKKAWENIRDSAVSTANEKKLAEEAYLKAVIKAYEDMGKKVDPEITARFDTLKSEIDSAQKTDIPNWTKAIGDSMTSVSTSITNAAQGMIGVLLGTEEGTVEDAVKKLGQGIVSSLVEPWLSAFSKIIEEGVKGLIGWLTGETGLKGALSTVSGWLGNLFGGGGGGVAGAAGSAGAGAAGSAGAGVAGAATGAAGAAMGIGMSLLTGGIAGGLSIVGSVIGASMMGGDLGKIEENTRFTQIGIIGEKGVIDILWQHNMHWWHSRGVWESINEKLGWMWEQMSAAVPTLLDRVREVVDRLVDLPSRMTDAMGAPVSITVQGNVIGNEEFLDYLARELARRAAAQGA